MKLVIVESPTKAKTLDRYMGKGYQVMATMGHVRDLPRKTFGVDIIKQGKQYQFIPEYVPDEKKSKIINQLKKAAVKAKEIFLATDPDREGEAIAWHVKEILTAKSKIKKSKFKKVAFHEITKTAIKKAFEDPRGIDLNLIDAQQARRILDRLVGYSLSPLLWKKVRRGLSAGRVQSVAVRLVVEREEEIKKFKSEKYYRIWAAIEKNGKLFLAQLMRIKNKPVEKKETENLFAGKYVVTKTILNSAKKAEEVILSLEPVFKITKIEKKEVFRSPPPPFITASLQQDASRRFGWSAKQTMRLAQSLFEKGRITYHRTDSATLSNQAISSIRKLIEKDYGGRYLPKKPVFYKTKSKLAQEAHEAIRPTKFIPLSQKRLKSPKEMKLYQLIWQRAVSSQMNPAKIAQTRIELRNKDYLFTTNGSQIIFDGFSRVYPVKFSENILPPLKEKEILPVIDLGVSQHETQSPPRYNEASLIATLEKNGIGRPSTYATIISTIQTRLYVEKKEAKFYPTPVGVASNEFLVKHFPDIVNLPFTAEMENSFDLIAQGEEDWQPILSDFWGPFSKKKTEVEENAKRVKVPVEETGRKCPKCKKGKLVIRTGRFGKFISCDRFPECDYKESYNEKADFKCPTCGSPVLIKTTKKGARFYACSKWPKCNWSSWRKPV